MFFHLLSDIYLLLIAIPTAIFCIAFISYGLSKEDKKEIKKLEAEKSLQPKKQAIAPSNT